MEAVCYETLKLSLLSSIGILLILAASPLMKKRCTVFWRYALWILLAVRLCIPFDLSVPGYAVSCSISNRQTAEPEQAPVKEGSYKDAAGEGAGKGEDSLQKEAAQKAKTDRTKSDDIGIRNEKQQGQHAFAASEGAESAAVRPERPLFLASIFWLAGMAAFLILKLTCYVVFRYRLEKTKAYCMQKEELPVYTSSIVRAPCLMGIRKPQILLPQETYDDAFLSLVLAHEYAHYKRKDLWVRLLFSAARMMHWFNPLVFLMERQMMKDMEFLCDSYVVKNFTKEEKKKYGETLLACASEKRRRHILFCASEFSRDATILKERLANIFAGTKRKKGILAMASGAGLLLFATFFLAFGSSVERLDAGMETEREEEKLLAQKEEDAHMDVELEKKQEAFLSLSLEEAATAVYGAVLPALLYASEERAILCDYWGLLIYDLKNERIEQLLNLKALDLAYMQGEHAAHIEVSKDGGQILLYPESKAKEGYIYDVDARRLSNSDLTSLGARRFEGVTERGEQTYVAMESGKWAYLSADSLLNQEGNSFHETDMQGLSLVMGENFKADTRVCPLFAEYYKAQKEQAIPSSGINWYKVGRLVGKEFLHEDAEGWRYYIQENKTGEYIGREPEKVFDMLLLTREKGGERQILEDLIFQETWRDCPILFVNDRIVYKAAKTGEITDMKAPLLVSIAMDGSDRRTADDILYHVADGLCEDDGWLYYSGWTNDAFPKPLCRIAADFSGGPQFVEDLPGFLCGVQNGWVYYVSSVDGAMWKRNLMTGEEELADKCGMPVNAIFLFYARETESGGCHIILRYSGEEKEYRMDLRF